MDERHRSRTAFIGDSPTEALERARAAFPDVLIRRAATPLDNARRRYELGPWLNDHAVVLRAASGSTGNGKVLWPTPRYALWTGSRTSVGVEAFSSGNVLTVYVRHRDTDLRYPVLVDPTVDQEVAGYQWTPCDSNVDSCLNSQTSNGWF